MCACLAFFFFVPFSDTVERRNRIRVVYRNLWTSGEQEIEIERQSEVGPLKSKARTVCLLCKSRAGVLGFFAGSSLSDTTFSSSLQSFHGASSRSILRHQHSRSGSSCLSFHFWSRLWKREAQVSQGSVNFVVLHGSFRKPHDQLDQKKKASAYAKAKSHKKAEDKAHH
ncbi:hypothetical protein HHK36_003008 [Tetracentron sinense]|uniref:Secreted protein n=1 Tax=Tetracentron sinense TaxID=13715 RepID=A0A835DRM9_TETSI|nr:hypothetical protein HHK36_003008 [Tetracentron sinense]